MYVMILQSFSMVIQNCKWSSNQVMQFIVAFDSGEMGLPCHGTIHAVISHLDLLQFFCSALFVSKRKSTCAFILASSSADMASSTEQDSPDAHGSEST